MKVSIISIASCFAFIVFSNLLSAQYINNLTIAAPTEIAGDYPVIEPRWAEATAPSFSGTATFVTDSLVPFADGCQAFLGDVVGKIAFIDRGNCPDSEKINSAHKSGAIAVVLCNEEPGIIGCLDYLLSEDLDTIPLFSISYESCQKIRVFLEGGETEVTFNYNCSLPTYGEEVIWGDETGEGDFSGGLNEWTVVNDMDSDTTWAWYDTPTLPDLFCTGAIGGTACNGYMAFPSSHYANPESGTPLCYNSTSEFCSGALISPTIDLSGQSIEGLFVGVRHDVRYWLSGSTSMLVSYDDGLTWPDSIHMSSGSGAAASLNSELGNDPDCQINSSAANTGFSRYLTLPIGNYQGQESIKLQFRHLGSYYFATIDDVTLINKKYLDIEIQRQLFAQAPARHIPLSQAQEIPLLVEINNNGNIDATEVKIEVYSYGPDGNLDASYVNELYQVQPVNCNLNEQIPFSDTHTPSEVGTHQILYKNVTEGDGVKENDTLSFSYKIVEDTDPWISVERPVGGSPDPLSGGEFTNILTDQRMSLEDDLFIDYAVAYTFYLPQGDNKFFNSVRFGMNALTTNSGDVKVYLYEWNPTVASFPTTRKTGEYQIPPEDRILVGCMGENVFGSRENSQPMSSVLLIQQDPADMTIKMAIADSVTGQPLVDADGNTTPLCLKDDQMYALVFVMNSNQDYQLEMLARPSSSGSAYDLSGYNYTMDALGKPYRSGTSLLYNLFQGGAFESELSALTFPGYFQPNSAWIEMDIRDRIDTPCFTSGSENLSTDLESSFTIFPNPTNEKINIDVNLREIASQVSFELMNINGEQVKSMTETKVKKGSYVMEVNNLPSGVYTLNVRSDADFTSKKVILTK